MNKNFLMIITLIFFMLFQTIPFNMAIAETAASITDVIGTAYERPISRLNALGVMIGDSEGFRLNDTIKRSEFAAVVIRALGLEQSAELFKGSVIFEDVPSEHWASGYIKIAAENGVIKGTSETTFHPDTNVTYEQAITMIMRALGYEERANAKGGYPMGFMVMAHETNLFNGVPDFGNQTAAATRGNVGYMMDNALEIPLMVENVSGTVIYGVTGTNEPVGQTLLEDKMRLNKYEGRVVDIKHSTDTSRVIVSVTKSRRASDIGNKLELTLLNYLKDSLNENYHINSIISVYEREGQAYGLLLESEVIFDYVEGINGETKASEVSSRVTSFDSIHDIKFKKVDISYTIKKQENNNSLNDLYDSFKISKAEGSSSLSSPSELIGKYVKAVVQNGNIVYIHAYNLVEGGRITSTSGTTELKFTRFESDNLIINRVATNERLLVILNGKFANYSDLKNDFIFDYHKSNNDLLIVASSEVVTNDFTSYSERDDITSLRIGENSYSLPSVTQTYFSFDNGKTYNINRDEALDILTGQSCKAYIDSKNEVRFLVGSIGTEAVAFHGVITGYYSEQHNYLKITKFEENGTFKELNIIVKDSETFNKAKNAKDNVLDNFPKWGSEDYYVSDTLADTNIIAKFTPNSKGEIEKIEPLSETGWVYPDTGGGYLFPGYSGGSTGSGVNPVASPNRLQEVRSSDIRLYINGSGEKQVNYTNSTRVVGLTKDGSNIVITPIPVSKINGRRIYDVIGMKFHIRQEYEAEKYNSSNNPSYTADFIIVYGADQFHSGDVSYGMINGTTRVSDSMLLVEADQYGSGSLTSKSFALKRERSSGRDLINGGTASISEKSIVSFWRNLDAFGNDNSVDADDSMAVIDVARFDDIKAEFENIRKGASTNVATQVYDIQESKFFYLKDSDMCTIDQNILVYEYDSYESIFRFSNYRNISNNDYVIPLYMRTGRDDLSDTLRIVVFERY